MEFYIKGVENKAGYLPYFPPSVAEPPPLTAAQGLPVRAATTVLLNSAKKSRLQLFNTTLFKKFISVMINDLYISRCCSGRTTTLSAPSSLEESR